MAGFGFRPDCSIMGLAVPYPNKRPQAPRETLLLQTVLLRRIVSRNSCLEITTEDTARTEYYSGLLERSQTIVSGRRRSPSPASLAAPLPTPDPYGQAASKVHFDFA